MTTTSAAPSAPTSAFVLSPSSLPPSPRDFLAYERIIIDGFSTRQAADELKISQTRVRQLVRKVADWLAENLPAHDETRQAAQIRLAQHIAADRLHRYLNEVEHAWHQTRETKYLSPIIRLLTALSKIPAHPHTLLALASENEVPPNVVPSRREGHEAEPTLHPDAAQPTASASSQIINPKSPISNSPPPPSRDCSPIPKTAANLASNNPTTSAPTLSTQTPSGPTQSVTNTARQSFLSPAHSPAAAGISPMPNSGATGVLPVLSAASNEPPAITQLQITPQSIGLTTPKHSTRHDRRRLQRLLAKK